MTAHDRCLPVNLIEDLSPVIRYPIAFLLPMVGALLLTPAVARLAHRHEVLDHPGGHKVHGQATPYLGGLAVGGGLMLVGLFAAGTNGELLTILGAGLMLGLVGLRDDVRSVSPWWRLSFEAAAGLALWVVGVRAGVFDLTITDLPLTVLWVVTVVNAFNFIDNMDGAAAGIAAASAIGIAAIAGHNGDFLVASLALAVGGAAIGFLRYNFPPARIFLGDAGSMLLGFLVAALTLKLDLPVGDAAPRVLSTVLLAAVPLFDLTLVMTARTIGRRPLMLGGTDHTTHRLREQGLPVRLVLLIMIAAQGICSALSFIVYQQPSEVVLVVGGALAVTWLMMLWLFLRMPEAATTREATAGVVVAS